MNETIDKIEPIENEKEISDSYAIKKFYDEKEEKAQAIVLKAEQMRKFFKEDLFTDIKSLQNYVDIFETFIIESANFRKNRSETSNKILINHLYDLELAMARVSLDLVYSK